MSKTRNIQPTHHQRFLLVASLVALASAAWASDPLPVGTGTGLGATYFINQVHSVGDLSGIPMLQRLAPVVNFDWGTGSPDPSIPPDQFAVVWNGYLEPQITGTHTVYLTSDDGCRIWIDGKPLINQWNVAAGTYTATIALVAGKQVPIRVDYFENTGTANIKLEWETPGMVRAVIPTSQLYPEALPVGQIGTGTGLLAGYFPGLTFTGTPTIRTDQTLRFSWPSVPMEGFPASCYSIRWQGRLVPSLDEPMTMILSIDDHVRWWVDGVQVVDAFGGAGGLHEYRYVLPAGVGVTHDIRIDYYNGPPPGTVKLDWESQHTPRQPVPSSQLYPATNLLTPFVTTGAGLSAEYFPNETLTGSALRRHDAMIFFGWGNGSSDSSLPVDHFSARWSGKIQMRFDETYTLTFIGDDGMRVWLNGVCVINDWVPTASRARSTTFAAKAGQLSDLRIEYFERTGVASAYLLWDSPSEGSAIVPEACLYPDDLDVDVPATSAVSPVFIEGFHGPGSAVTAGAGSVTQLGASRFAIEQTLDPVTSTTVTITAGIGVAKGAVSWTPTLLDSNRSLVVRPGDSLLFKAVVSGTLGIGVNCGTLKDLPPINAGDVRPIRFDSPGYYQVNQYDINGNAVATVSVAVPQVVTSASIPVAVNYVRNKDVAFVSSGDQSLVTWTTADQWATVGSIAVTGLAPTAKRLTVRSDLSRPTCLMARINGSSGPVLASVPILPFVLRSDSEKLIHVIASFPDGSMLCRSNVFLEPWIPGLRVKLFTIVSGVTLDDSTTVRWITSDQFVNDDSRGTYILDLIRAPVIHSGVCNWRLAYDGMDQVSP